MAKKISAAETEKAIARIREKYNNLIVTYMLDPRIREGFEQRLFEIRKNNFDPLRFLHDEIKSIHDIERKEKEKINSIARDAAKEKSKENINNEAAPRRDFADKVLEQLMARIEKYPDIFIHHNANPEIGKLFGALIDFDAKMWPAYEKLAKKYRVNRYDPSFTRLENMLNNFTRIYTEDVPSRLLGYRSMLASSFTRNKDVAREEKRCILECAFLVKALKDTIAELMANPEILQGEKEKLLKLVEYLDRIADDFRLRDLMTLGK